MDTQSAGTKIISKGNHDLWWSRIKYLNSLYDDIVFLQNDCYAVDECDIVIAASEDGRIRALMNILSTMKRYMPGSFRECAWDLMQQKSQTGCSHNSLPSLSAERRGRKGDGEFTKILEEYGVWKCIYGHLHGMPAFERGIKGNVRGVEYSLVSLDYIGAKPKLIYDERVKGGTK